MRIHLSFIIVLMLGICPTAYAVPDRWEKSSDALSDNYIISDAKKNTFTLSCTSLYNEKAILLHHVKVTSPTGALWDSRDEVTNVSIYVEGEEYPVPEYFGWRYGHITWLKFIEALKRSETFEVYTDGEKVATFSPGAMNTSRTLGELDDCTTITYEG